LRKYCKFFFTPSKGRGGAFDTTNTRNTIKTRKLEELEELDKLESFYPSALRAPPLPKVGEELLTPQILEELEN